MVGGFAENIDQRFAEGGNIVRIAAGDDIAVLRDFLVHHIGTCIGEVGADRRPAGDGLPVDQPPFCQQPWRMANRGNRFARHAEFTHDRNGTLVHA